MGDGNAETNMSQVVNFTTSEEWCGIYYMDHRQPPVFLEHGKFTHIVSVSLSHVCTDAYIHTHRHMHVN